MIETVVWLNFLFTTLYSFTIPDVLLTLLPLLITPAFPSPASPELQPSPEKATTHSGPENDFFLINFIAQEPLFRGLKFSSFLGLLPLPPLLY